MFYQTWLIAFIATVVAEMAVAIVWSRLNRCKTPFVEVLTVNLMTHPLAFWFASQGDAFMSIELAVILAEACAYRLMLEQSWERVGILALLSNAATITLSYMPNAF